MPIMSAGPMKMIIETDMIPIGDGNCAAPAHVMRSLFRIETDMIPIGDGNTAIIGGVHEE